MFPRRRARHRAQAPNCPPCLSQRLPAKGRPDAFAGADGRCIQESVNNVCLMNSYKLQPVGFIRSTVKGREDAPRQGPEGAPDAWLEIEPQFAEALLGMGG